MTSAGRHPWPRARAMAALAMCAGLIASSATAPAVSQAKVPDLQRGGATSQFAGACSTSPFSDVPASDPFCAEIEWMKVNGISTGFPDGTFRPLEAASRQAMSAFMARLAGAINLPACSSPPFTDVPANGAFCIQIRWMKETQISLGFGDGSYRPAAPVTRQAMSAFMARLAGETTPRPCSVPPFTDVAVGDPFCPEITWMKEQGISTGFDDGTFRPLAPVSRQAMAAFMHRLARGGPGVGTIPPRLLIVSNYQANATGSAIYVDFVFDKYVANSPLPPNPARFVLIATDGAVFRGTALFKSTVPPGQTSFAGGVHTISVRFGATPADLPGSQLARGYVEEDTLCHSKPPFRCNPLQASDAPDAATSLPDLVRVRRISSTQLEYTFDQPVSAASAPTASAPDAGRFGIYDAAGRWDTANNAVRSTTQAGVVIATFNEGISGAGMTTNPPQQPPRNSAGPGQGSNAGPVDVSLRNGVGAFVFAGAVSQSENPNVYLTNRDDETGF